MAQVFCCEFCEVFKNTYHTEHLRMTVLYLHFVQEKSNCQHMFLSFRFLHSLFCAMQKKFQANLIFVDNIGKLNQNFYVTIRMLLFKVIHGCFQTRDWLYGNVKPDWNFNLPNCDEVSSCIIDNFVIDKNLKIKLTLYVKISSR